MCRKKGLAAFNLEKADIVILGTFPSDTSITMKKYYSSPRNHFWCLLSLDDLKKLKIGLWDVIESCKRENGSADKNIKEPKYNDLCALRGKKILFNGKRAYEYFLTAQNKQKIDLKVSKKQILPSSSSASRVDFQTKKKKWDKIIGK